jgi:Sulfotransferase family
VTVQKQNRAILVTGSIRSGSTWVGKMLGTHPRIYYVSEPFNTDRPRCPAKYRFHYVTAADEEEFRRYLRPHLEFRYPLWDVLRDRNHPEGRLRVLLRSVKHLYRRLRGHRPLLKDPHALFSAGWLARNYPLDVVVLIRHPAAFVSSMKRLGWEFCFNHLLRQKELLADLLSPYEADMHRLILTPHSGLDEAVLLWRVVHGVIRRFRVEHPDWTFVRHEDLSLSPVKEYRRLFDRLRLTMTPAVSSAILEHTSKENPSEAAPGVVHQLKRDSKANVWNWRHRLTANEVLRIRRATEDIASHFYADADWEVRRDTRRFVVGAAP